MDDDNMIKCPYCDRMTDGTRSLCGRCGTNLKTGEPPKPSYLILLIACGAFALSTWMLVNCIKLLKYFEGNSGVGALLFSLLFFGVSAYMFFCGVIYWSRLYLAYKRKDIYTYRKLIKWSKEKEDNVNRYKNEKKRGANVPTCPICHSDIYVNQSKHYLRNSPDTLSYQRWYVCTSCNREFSPDVLGKKTQESAAEPSPYVWQATPSKAKQSQPTHIEKPAPSDTDPVQELRRYKQLLDEGVITQDDFDKKKKQLLGI